MSVHKTVLILGSAAVWVIMLFVWSVWWLKIFPVSYLAFALFLVQHECIPQAILGMDILCQAKSGMGKTAVFVLATLQQIEPVDGQVSWSVNILFSIDLLENV